MVSRKMHEALAMARHELVALNGMLGSDGAAPNETFKIDTSEAIERLDETTKEAGLNPIRITPRRRRTKNSVRSVQT
jgi:hypothetical protein